MSGVALPRAAGACVLALACAACTSDLDSFVTAPGGTAGSSASSSASSLSSSVSGSAGSVGSGGAGGGGASASGGGGAASGGTGGAAPPCSPGDSYTLTDDFNDGATAPAWTPAAYGIGTTSTEAGGQLQFASANSLGAADNYAVSVAGPFDIRGCWVLVHAVALPVDDVQTFIAFGINQFDDAVAIGADQGKISLCVAVGGTADCVDVDHLGEGDDWWRIREEAGVLKLETAPEGTMWTTRKEIMTPPYATSGNVELGMGSPDPVDLGYTGALDDFNLPPP